MIRRLFSPLPTSSRRAGGRTARRMERAAPLAAELCPVRPGLAGGQYRPLDDDAVRAWSGRVPDPRGNRPQSGAGDGGRIHDRRWCYAGDDGRVRFPRALVDDMLAKAARTSRLWAGSKHDMLLSDRGCITAPPARPSMLSMSRTTATNPILPTSMMRRGSSRTWTTSISSVDAGS